MPLEQNLTQEQLATNGQTWRHIWNIQRFLLRGSLVGTQRSTRRFTSIPGMLHALTQRTLEPEKVSLELMITDLIGSDRQLEEIILNTVDYIQKVSHYANYSGGLPYVDQPNNLVIFEIQRRCLTHDQSKLVPPEVELFTTYTPQLKGCVFGSPEYNEFLIKMKPALANHYAQNRHHPEHYEDGINGMNLFDIYEMMCDWMASSLRNKGGSFAGSVAHCRDRFGISDVVIELMEASYELIFKDEYARAQEYYYTQKLPMEIGTWCPNAVGETGEKGEVGISDKGLGEEPLHKGGAGGFSGAIGVSYDPQGEPGPRGDSMEVLK